MTIRALTLLVLRCRDIEKSRAFYDGIGLVLSAEQHGDGPRHYSACIGPSLLELYPHSGADSRGLRIGLRVTDLSRALACAERLGGRVLRVGAPPRTPVLSAASISSGANALLEDPDGHQLELTEEA